MYAAAGGASLASRQARQRQRQKQLQQLKIQKDQKPQPPKQYHNYTADVGVPKLSRVERGTLRPPQGPNERRHSASNYHLKEPPKSRLRESPSISIPVQSHHHHAPPCPLVENHVLSTPTLQLPQITIPEGDGGLERRCSFVRQVEEMEKSHEGGLLDKCNHLCNFEIKDKTWETKYGEVEKDVFGSLDYPFSEIHDATYGGGSDEDDFFSVYHQSAAANALLYVGLGTTAIGSVIFFVGTGEKGFKTLELRLIGPTLIACGLLCCLIRVLLCAVPSTCFRKKTKMRLKNNACLHSSHRFPRSREYPEFRVDSASLLAKTKKKVSIVPPSHPFPGTSTQDFKEASIREENMMKLPQINLPDVNDKTSRDTSLFELQNLELVYEIESVSSDESDDNEVTVISATQPQLTPNKANVNRETCLSVVIERNNSENCDGRKSHESSEKQTTHSGIVLSPLQLGQ